MSNSKSNLTLRQINQHKAVKNLYENDLLSMEAACGKVGISKATYYRINKKVNEELNKKNQKGGNKNVTDIIYNEQEIELKASVSVGTQNVFWYHNNQLVGKFEAHKSVFIKPEYGKNTITCTDENGKSVNVWFEARGL